MQKSVYGSVAKVGAHAAALACLLGVPGCVAAGAELDSEEVASSEEPLLLTGAKWPSGSVKVCLVSNANMPATDRETIRERIRRVTNENWGRVANLHFWGFGDCQASDNGGRVVRITFNLAVSNQSGVGSSSTSPTAMNFQWEGGAFPPNDSLILHEFGHALGFSHEQNREDWVAPNGNCPKTGNATSDTLGTPADTNSIMRSTGGCVGIEVLSPWDIVGVQRAYGVKPAGVIVGMNNQCVDIPDAQASLRKVMQVSDCHAQSNQRWRYSATRTISSPGFSPSTLDIVGASTNAGADIQLFSTNNPLTSNQRWQFKNVAIVGLANKCLDVPNGDFSPGIAVNLHACNTGTNQQWTLEPSGTAAGGFRFHAGGGNTCIAQGSTNPSSGEDLRLATCSGTDAKQLFTVSSTGQIRSNNNLCWDIEGGDPTAAAAPTQLFTCKTDAFKQNQQFHVRGNISSDLTNRCLTTNTSNFRSRDRLESWPCLPGAADFVWDYYFNP